jgi:hypothetical protein
MDVKTTVELLKVNKAEDELLIRLNIDISDMLQKILPLYSSYGLDELEDKKDFISLFIGVISNDIITYVVSGDFVDEVETVEGYINLVKQISTKLYEYEMFKHGVEGGEDNYLEDNLRQFSMESFELLRDDIDSMALEIINLLEKNSVPSKKVLGIYVEKIIFLDKTLITGIGSFIMQIKK